MRRRDWLGLLGAVCLTVAGCRPVGEPEATSEGSPTPQESLPELGALSLASGSWAPFTDEAGKPRLAIDLVHQALRRSGIAVETTLIHPQQLMAALEAGDFDGSEALWKTEEREEYLHFSSPYLENRLVLLARKDTDVSATNLAALPEGARVGLVDNYAYGPKILEAETSAELVLGLSDEGNLRALLEKKLDYILVDDLLVYYLFEYTEEKANRLLTAGKAPLTTRSLHFAVQRDRPDAERVIKEFNERLKEMLRDGTYQEVLHVGWLRADVDRDGQVEIALSGKQAGTAPPQHEYAFAGATGSGTRFLVDGEVYGDWQSIPDQYKVELDRPDDLYRFKPGINLVLADF